jgi:hypothetical protein
MDLVRFALGLPFRYGSAAAQQWRQLQRWLARAGNPGAALAVQLRGANLYDHYLDHFSDNDDVRTAAEHHLDHYVHDNLYGPSDEHHHRCPYDDCPERWRRDLA